MRKSRSEQSRLYRGMDNKMKAMKDNNACSVIATAIAFGITYQEAYDEYELVGRVHGRGVSTFQIEQVSHRLAHRIGGTVKSVKHMDKLKMVMGVTPTINNITRILPKKGKYLVITRDHVVACKGGRMHDWSEGRKLQVKQILEVEV